MTPAYSGTPADADVIFNKLNVALAKRQGLLASLMGVAPYNKPNQKPLQKIQQQEENDFSADPELLGIGGKVPDDDEVNRQRKSSNHELKRQLLGKDYEKKQRVKKDSAPKQQVVSKPTSTTKQGALSQRLQNPEVDSEEDAGRSSLGKRKRNRPLQVDKHKALNAEAGVQKERQVLDNDSQLPKPSITSSLPQSKNDLDEVLLQQSSHVQKKRKKNKKKKKTRKEE